MHEIKRASLERDFMHRPSADGVINIHTARHKSSTQHKHAPKRHHPTQNATPQASIRPEADYLNEKKSAVQCAVGGCAVLRWMPEYSYVV